MKKGGEDGMMRYMRRFVLMLQFFTSVPIPARLKINAEDYGKGLVFAPLTGLVIGLVLAVLYWAVSSVFATFIAAIIVFIVYIILTGGLHLDGLGDTFDGLFSNRPKERILEIMRDSRVGTNAVLAIISVILLDVALLSHIATIGNLEGSRSFYVEGAWKFGGRSIMFLTLLLMPAMGRVGSLIGAGISKYAREGNGLGRHFIDNCGIRDIIVGMFIFFFTLFAIFTVSAMSTGTLPFIDGVGFFQTSLFSWLSLTCIALFFVTFPALTSFLLTLLLTKKLSGATGDILGAVCELNQTVFLLLIYLLTNIIHY